MPTADAADARTAVTNLFGVALLPVAIGWFLAHDLTLLLFEGQNFIALALRPARPGLGPLRHHRPLRSTTGIDHRRLGPVGAAAALLAGHVGAVVLAHDGAIARLGRRRGMRVTWTVAGAAAVSVVAAALLVLG